MPSIFIVHVENKPGALTRVVSLFRRRGIGIVSLAVGRTEKPDISRMTISLEADDDQVPTIEANLYRFADVIFVENISAESSIVRDLVLIKVAAIHDARSRVLELTAIFRGRVVDVTPDSLTIEITGTEHKIDTLIEVLRPFGVLEMVRSGIVAMRRGARPN
jgi:acetolactate synthase I/III small subunit